MLEQLKNTPVQGRTFIITLFGDAIMPHGGRIWLGSLIHLLEIFGLKERLVRTSVYRFIKEDLLVSETFGRRADYTISESGRRRFAQADKIIYADGTKPWDKRWRLLLATQSMAKEERLQMTKALSWYGFGVLGRDHFIHPSVDLVPVIESLKSDGVELTTIKKFMPMLTLDLPHDLCASQAELIKNSWHLDALTVSYDKFVEVYQPILDWLRDSDAAHITDEEAFVLRVRLIHDYRRLLLRDPRFPDELQPQQWPGKQAALITKTIYRRMIEPSERFLSQHFEITQGEMSSNANAILADRFMIAHLLD